MATAAGALTTVVRLQSAATGTAPLDRTLTTPVLLAGALQATAALTGALQAPPGSRPPRSRPPPSRRTSAKRWCSRGPSARPGRLTGGLTTTVSLAGSAVGAALGVGALTTESTAAGEARATATAGGALFTVSAADLGPTLPTHTQRETAIRITEPVLYPLTVARQGGVFVTDPRVIRTTAPAPPVAGPIPVAASAGLPLLLGGGGPSVGPTRWGRRRTVELV